MEALWTWAQNQGATVAVLCLVAWRLDGHLVQFRSDLDQVHRQVLGILGKAFEGK